MLQEDGSVQEFKIIATPECRCRCYPYLSTYSRILHPQGIHQGYFHTSYKKVRVEGWRVDGGHVIKYGEFLVCISLQFMMATIQDFNCHDFWINRTTDTFEMSTYHFNDILSWNHFK